MKRGRRLSRAMVLFEKNRKHGVVWKRRRLFGAMVLSVAEKEREIGKERSRWRALNICEWERERRRWKGWEEREGLG